jgi:nicotinate-nucleotide pyrophosphorylase (carboxylating)
MIFDNKFYSFVDQALLEDVGDGDHSTLCCIPAGAKGKAQLKIKQDGVLAGVDVAEKIFLYKDPSASIQKFKADGQAVHTGEIAFEVEASIHTILQCERLVLNCMQRMSGIATLTSEYVSKIKLTNTKLLDTRKTTPNFRLLEKEAVRIGGGVNHRFGLYDMIMLKDNHIDYSGGIEVAIAKAYEYAKSRNLKIEVEARSLQDVEKIIEVGKGKVCRIMLDNFTPTSISAALKLINGTGFETEASGGINLDNILSYAQTGVDYISVGALIHQAKSIDLSLKAILIK